LWWLDSVLIRWANGDCPTSIILWHSISWYPESVWYFSLKLRRRHQGRPWYEYLISLWIFQFWFLTSWANNHYKKLCSAVQALRLDGWLQTFRMPWLLSSFRNCRPTADRALALWALDLPAALTLADFRRVFKFTHWAERTFETEPKVASFSRNTFKGGGSLDWPYEVVQLRPRHRSDNLTDNVWVIGTQSSNYGHSPEPSFFMTHGSSDLILG
jgi:hypothetical protein